MKLYILRHGTTTWNALRKIQGCTDIPLDETGEEIARLTGLALKEAGRLNETQYRYAEEELKIRYRKTP